MRPIRNQILFKPFLGNAVSEGGLLIPETARKLSNRGTIEAVGIGLPNKPMNLKVGDIGYRVKDWGEGIIMNGETYFLMDAEAIIAIE